MKRLSHVGWWIAAGSVALAACSSNPSAPVGGGGAADSTLEVSARVSAQVDTRGGRLETTGGDGATYVLEVPSGALRRPVTLVMTPYRSAPDVGDLGPFGRGIRLEPDGVEFERPVAVRIDLPAGTTVPPTATLYHWADGDSAGEILPAVVAGRRLSAWITHFSSVAPISPTEAQLLRYLGALSLTVRTFGAANALSELSAMVDVYVFVEASPGAFPSIDLAALSTEIEVYLDELATIGEVLCGQGRCAEGTHLLEHAESLALSMRLSSVLDRARTVRLSCGGAVIDLRLRYPADNCVALTGGQTLPLDVTVFDPGIGAPAGGARVRLWLSGTGGTLGSTSGVTDSLGHWSTSYTTPDAFSGVAEIHATIEGGCDPNYEVVEYVSAQDAGAGDGPVFGFGIHPAAPRNWTGHLEVLAAVAGGEYDDGTSLVRRIEGACGDSTFSAIETQTIGGPMAFAYGYGSATATVTSSYDAIADVYDLTFTCASAGAARGSYAAWSGYGNLAGTVVYQRPGGAALPAGAVLKCTVEWQGNVTQVSIPGYVSYNATAWNQLVSDTRSFDIPVTTDRPWVPIGVAFGLGGESSASPAAWSMDGTVRLSVVCENCQP